MTGCRPAGTATSVLFLLYSRYGYFVKSFGRLVQRVQFRPRDGSDIASRVDTVLSLENLYRRECFVVEPAGDGLCEDPFIGERYLERGDVAHIGRADL